MDGRPVVIRLLDPPLHEFLPSHDELSATTMESDDDAVAMLVAVEEMREVNPMLGLRGCRVGLMFPRIYEMQTHSILEAARRVSAGRRSRTSAPRSARWWKPPRAALTADSIAESADFFSFGTNDLTQTTFAFSRDDAEGKFLLRYVRDGVLKENPFQVLDQDGVGRLVERACELGR